MFKILVSLFFVFITFSVAADDSYVFEAKGEFAKELKSLVEKYSKEGKIEAKVYKKEDKSFMESKTKTILSVFKDNTAEELKYANVEQGERLYQRKCASCHGVKANSNKYATPRKLSTLKPLKIVELLEGYQSNYDGKFGGSLRNIMKPQADGLVSDEMQSIAVYIYTLNHDTKLPNAVESTQDEESDENPTSYLQ
ncbi:c-type cytochrome [Sulfurospirillum arcachonense]|uniref:c-type cytochrome n=1 Tax=Sulfurospirillum arcachonense TaxID=57666 RepID=UPI0004691E2F|nr:c-type cytochrome [Sulfurospirillum arcachonense]